MLTNEQIKQYHDRGYLVVENAIDPCCQIRITKLGRF